MRVLRSTTGVAAVVGGTSGSPKPMKNNSKPITSELLVNTCRRAFQAKCRIGVHLTGEELMNLGGSMLLAHADRSLAYSRGERDDR
jgi:hypothetical protein